MKRLLSILTLGALTLASAGAQDASDFESLAGTSATDEATPASANLGTFKWSGDQEFAWRWGVAEDPTRTGGLVDGKLAGEYKFGDLKLVGAASVRNEEFVPGETLIQWSPGAFRFTAGLTEFSWGLADKKNPTDTLNSRDYRYGANADRLVNPAVSVAWYPVDWVSLEAVYEPWKELSEFPKDFEASVQAGLSSTAAAMKASALGVAFANYAPVATTEDFERNFDRPVYGTRANFFLTGVDLSLSYVYDWDTYYTPVVTMRGINAGAAGTLWFPDRVDLVLKRVHRVGVNAKTTIDRYGLWIESAYNVTEDPEGNDDAVRNNKLSWTTGLDFNFGPGSAYYLNVQYAGEWVLDYDDATVSDYAAAPTVAQMNDKDYMLRQTYRSLVQSLGSESERLMNTITANVKFPLADATVTPNLSVAVIVPSGYDDTNASRIASAYFKPELDLAPVDGIHVLFGADLAYGWVKKDGSSDVSLDTTTDKLGIYTPQNAVYVKVQYKWNGSWGN